MRKNRNNNEIRDNVCGKFIIRETSHKEATKETPEPITGGVPNPFEERSEPITGGVPNPFEDDRKTIPAEPLAGKVNGVMPQIESMFGRYWWLTAIVIVYLLIRDK